MTSFIAHLINQQVCHELLGLQLLTILLEKPTDDSVELAVNFVTEAGAALQELSPQGLNGGMSVFFCILSRVLQQSLRASGVSSTKVTLTNVCNT